VLEPCCVSYTPHSDEKQCCVQQVQQCAAWWGGWRIQPPDCVVHGGSRASCCVGGLAHCLTFLSHAQLRKAGVQQLLAAAGSQLSVFGYLRQCHRAAYALSGALRQFDKFGGRSCVGLRTVMALQCA
jgi:hypothetical protein